MDASILPDLSKVQPKNRSAGPSVARLRSEWPLVFSACQETYFPGSTFGLISSTKTCQAGYMLAAVSHFEQLCQERFVHKNLDRTRLDFAAAREIRYQFRRGRTFRNTEAALYKCLLNLVVERPEKILGNAVIV